MKAELIKQLYQINAIKFGSFTLKSGATSPIYIDLRNTISYPNIMRQIAEYMWQTVHHISFDLVCGVPYTALPFATCISLLYNKPMVMRRKEAKLHGTKKIVEGVYEEGQTCLIVEDVVTSATSILETINDLETAGIKVKHAVALVDREQGGKEILKSKNYEFHSVITLNEILEIGKESQPPLRF